MKNKFRFLNQEEGQVGEGGPAEPVAAPPETVTAVTVPALQEVTALPPNKAPVKEEQRNSAELIGQLEKLQYDLLMVQHKVPEAVKAYLPKTSAELKTFLASEAYTKLATAFTPVVEAAPAVPSPPSQTSQDAPKEPKAPNFERVGRRLML